MDIILYLLHYIQYQHQQICWLLNFICRYIPRKVCSTMFSQVESRFSRSTALRYPHCLNTLVPKKERKHFITSCCNGVFQKFGKPFKFDITQVIGLTNNDEVSKEFRPYKQMIERLNRTYKLSYRPTNGFDNYEGANYDLAL